MSTNETPKPAKQVEVTLAKPHTHAGARFDAGAKIQVTESERDWLIANQIVAGKATTTTTTTTEATGK